MPICPPLKIPERRDEFNSVIERLGGRALDEASVVKRDEYLKSLNKRETAAYHRAYALWDLHKGEVAAITRVLAAETRIRAKARGPRTPTRTVKTEAESRRQAPIAGVISPRGGAPTTIRDWFRGRQLRAPRALAGDMTKGVQAGWDKFLNLAVRNLSQLRRASPEAHTAALRAGGARGQATVLLQLATAKIDSALKGSGISWEMVRAALVESRLRGIRERYLDFANQALAATDEELADAIHSGLVDVLKHIEGRAGLNEDLAQRAVALAGAEDWNHLRDFLAGTFEIAADRVGRIPMGPDPNAFEKLTAKPAFREALRLYKELIEKPVAESHAINEGVFSDALGPLNTYFPLVAVKEDGGILHRIFGVTKYPYRKPRNIANHFATGLAEHGYSLEMEDFADRIRGAIRTNNKAALLSELDKQGLIRALARNEKAGESMVIDGVTVPAEAVDTQADLLVVRDGKSVRLPGARALIPTMFKKELKPILEREGRLEPGMGDSLVNAITQFALVGPLDFVFHSTNILGTLTANTPFLGPGIANKTIWNTPLTKLFGSIIRVIRTDPSTEESIKDLQEMAQIGLVPPRFGSATYSRRYAELTGAKRTFGFGPAIYGPKGIDVRARLVMWRIAKLDKSMTPQERFDFVSQLGIYNRELESQIERWAKASRLAPFATAGTAMLRNGINAWTGMMAPPAGKTGLGGPGGTEGGGGGAGEPTLQGQAKRTAYRLAALLSGGAPGLIALWVLLHKLYRGKYPWQEENPPGLFEIQATEKDRNSTLGRTLWGTDPTREGRFNMAFFSPLVARGSRALGIKGAYDTKMLGGTAGQATEYAQRDIMNSLAHPFVSGPLVRAPFVFASGEEPQLSDPRDITGRYGLHFFPATVKAAPGAPQLIKRGEEALLNVNPFFQATGAALGIGDRGVKKDGQPAKWTKMITDVVAPRLIGSSIDIVASKERLAKAQKAATSERTPDVKVPDDVKVELHKQGIILSKPNRKPGESDTEYSARAEQSTASLSERIRAMVKSDAFQSLDKSAKATALKEAIKDAREETSRERVPTAGAGLDLDVAAKLAHQEARAKMEDRAEFKALSKEQQQDAHRQLGELFRMFAPTSEKLPEDRRTRIAERALQLLKSYQERGIIDRQMNQILARAARKAA